MNFHRLQVKELGLYAHYQLKKLALEEGSNIQKMGTEALNDLFIKYKQPPIA